MNIFAKTIAALSIVSLVPALALADTPRTLAGPHTHGVVVSGKIDLFRAQEKGLEIGSKEDYLDAEVLVTLDSQPGKVYGISVHDNDPSVNAIVETLRQAYLNGVPVTLQHRIAPGKNNLKIIWVQLGQTPAWASGN